jgi:hypothetical protein
MYAYQQPLSPATTKKLVKATNIEGQKTLAALKLLKGKN